MSQTHPLSALPPAGSTNWYEHYQSMDSAVRHAQNPNSPIVRLSDFPGANDDQRLSAAMAYCQGRTFSGTTIWLDENRLYTFNQQQTLYNGFSIMGNYRPQDQARASAPLANRINIRMNGGWFVLPDQSQTFGCSWQNLSIDGNQNNRLVEGHASRVLWTSTWRDISIQNASGVLGSTSARLLLTACAIDGFWNVNNVRHTALSIGGSDNRIAPTQFLLDCPPALRDSSSFLLTLNALSKTPFYNFYITAEQWSGITIPSGNSSQLISFTGFAIEGRNANQSCYGALIRMNGNSTITLRDCFLAYAMSDPGQIGRGDAGVIHATNGSVLLDGCSYRRANGVATTVPILYATGGSHIVRNMRSDFTGGQKPVVAQTSPGLIDADNSVEVVTV